MEKVDILKEWRLYHQLVGTLKLENIDEIDTGIDCNIED